MAASSSSLDTPEVKSLALEVLQYMTGEEVIKPIPYFTLQEILPEALTLENITMLIATLPIQDWITNGENESVLLNFVNKNKQSMHSVFFSPSVMKIDGLHDWRAARTFAKSYTTEMREWVENGIAAIKETLKNEINGTLEEVSSELESLWRYTASAENIFTISLYYSTAISLKITELEKSLKELESASEAGSDKKVIESDLKELKALKDWIIDRLRNDAITAIIAAKTARRIGNSSKIVTDLQLDATVDETLQYYKNNYTFMTNADGIPVIVRTSSIGSDFLESPNGRQKRVNQSLRGELASGESSQSSQSSQSDLYNLDDGIAVVPQTIPPPITHSFPPGFGITMPTLPPNAVPFPLRVLIDRGTFQPSSDLIRQLIDKNINADHKEQFDLGGISKKLALGDTNNLCIIAFFKVVNVIYITLIQPTKVTGNKLGNTISLYRYTDSYLQLIKMYKPMSDNQLGYNPMADLKPNVNHLAMLVGAKVIDSNFARLLKFMADRLVLEDITQDAPSRVVIATNDKFAAWSMLISTFLESDIQKNKVIRRKRAVQMMLTTMTSKSFVLNAVLYSESEATMADILAKQQILMDEKLKLLDEAKMEAKQERDAAEMAKKAALAAEAREAAETKTAETKKKQTTRHVNRLLTGINKKNKNYKKLPLNIQAQLIQELVKWYEDNPDKAITSNRVADDVDEIEVNDAEAYLRKHNRAFASIIDGEQRPLKQLKTGGEKNTYKTKKSKKSRKSRKHKSKKSRKSRKHKSKKPKKSIKPKKTRKQSQYKSLFSKTLKKHYKK